MSEQDQELAPFLVITINGVTGSFRAFKRANQWALMASAAADKSGKYADAMAANYNVAMTSVLPGDRAAFNQFMIENSADGDYTENLFEGLGRLWAGETMLPLERESTDGSASTSETSSESTPNSSEPESAALESTEMAPGVKVTGLDPQPMFVDGPTGPVVIMEEPVGSSTPA